MSKKSSLKTADEFDEFPELIQDDMGRARFRINLQDAPRKQRVNIMLDSDVIAYSRTRPVYCKIFKRLKNDIISNC